MYPYPQHNNNGVTPRPFIIGFILLMLFLSMSNDAPSHRQQERLHQQEQLQQQQQQQQGVAAAAAAQQPGGLNAGSNNLEQRTGSGVAKEVKAQLIYDLSVANERLEDEVHRLKQYVLDIRRAARQAGCELTDSAILTIYPEFNDMFTNNTEPKMKLGSGSGKDAVSKPAGQAGKPAAAEDSSGTSEEAAAGAAGEATEQSASGTPPKMNGSTGGSSVGGGDGSSSGASEVKEHNMNQNSSQNSQAVPKPRPGVVKERYAQRLAGDSDRSGNTMKQP